MGVSKTINDLLYGGFMKNKVIYLIVLLILGVLLLIGFYSLKNSKLNKSEHPNNKVSSDDETSDDNHNGFVSENDLPEVVDNTDYVVEITPRLMSSDLSSENEVDSISSDAFNIGGVYDSSNFEDNNDEILDSYVERNFYDIIMILPNSDVHKAYRISGSIKVFVSDSSFLDENPNAFVSQFQSWFGNYFMDFSNSSTEKAIDATLKRIDPRFNVKRIVFYDLKCSEYVDDSVTFSFYKSDYDWDAPVEEESRYLPDEILEMYAEWNGISSDNELVDDIDND